MNKKFYNKLVEVCKRHNVRYRFYKEKMPWGGMVECWENKIHVCTYWHHKYVIPSVYHEIAHILNYRNKKFVRYHEKHCSMKAIRQIGLRAERYTDKVAAKLMKEDFPRLKYDYRYNTKHGVKFWREWMGNVRA